MNEKQKEILKRIKAADPAMKSSDWLCLLGNLTDEQKKDAITTFKNLNFKTDFTQVEKNLNAIRDEMNEDKIDAFIVFRGDEFNNEYVPACNERLAFATGFTGSAGLAILEKENAHVFTDSRYTLQVRKESPKELFTYNDHTKDALLQWIKDNVKKNMTIGLDDRIVNIALMRDIKKSVEQAGGKIKTTFNNNTSPLDRAWNKLDRPPQPLSPIIIYDETIAGETIKEKLTMIGRDIQHIGADLACFNLLDSIAWVLNIRGRDIACTPVVLSYLTIDQKGQANFFVDEQKLDHAVRNHLDNANVSIHPIDQFFSYIGSLSNQKILVHAPTMASKLKTIAEKAGNEIIAEREPCQLPKAIKTKQEQEAFIKAHITDGVALVKFLHWLDTKGQSGHVMEQEAEQTLEKFRCEHPDYKGPSFDTIAGAGAHGAIVHYRSSKQSNAPLEKNSLFLCDSGGQYLGGTTDVTRTIVIGTPTAEMKDRFTRVLKGHIGIASQVMDKGTTGADIDNFARAPLRADGVDYGHGTGHGVGIYLSVHEGPCGISSRNTTPFEPGMVISNEPGYYKENEFGIRIENLVLVQENDQGKLYFKTMTMAPIDRSLIDLPLMEPEEIEWLNEYHRTVYQTLCPLLDQTHQTWLEKVCAPIEQSPSLKKKLNSNNPKP